MRIIIYNPQGQNVKKKKSVCLYAGWGLFAGIQLRSVTSVQLSVGKGEGRHGKMREQIRRAKGL